MDYRTGYVYEYIKINNAINLLKSTDKSVEYICQEVGYTNISYFNKAFKARTGTTPGNFRRELYSK